MHDDLLDVLIGCGCRRECCCGDKGQRDREGAAEAPSNLFQSAGRTRPQVLHDDDNPFVPPIPSWDSPQRPAQFGTIHIPATDAEGRFDGESGAPAGGGMLLDSGQIIYPGATYIDHVARTVQTWTTSEPLSDPAYTPGGAISPPLGQASLRPEQDRLKPFYFETLQTGFPAFLINLSAQEAGTQRREVRAETMHWDGTQTQEVIQTLTRPGTLYTAGAVALAQGDPPEPTEERYIRTEQVEVWTQPPEGPEYRVRERLVQGVRAQGDPVPLWRVSLVNRALTEWGTDLQPVGTRTVTPVSPLEWQAFEPWPDQTGSPSGVRFRSPDGRVTVESEVITRPAHDLTGATLIAYGHSLTSGTWAALRGLPVKKEDGTWNFDTVVVLHEVEDTVTAVTSGGVVRTCTREVFEVEILRVAQGTFQSFSPIGLMHHSWPPQWAFAVLISEVRALAAHDPWRDSYKRRQVAPLPRPAHWIWAGRPAKPPRTRPASAPSPPLPVTLADVLPASQDEGLPRGEGPLLLPTTVEVQQDGQWTASPAALGALAKRQLYGPAEWPEELDDTRSTKGALRVAWDEEKAKGKAVLLLRAKLVGPGPLTLTINGAEFAPQRLGHNVGERRGWHPYVLRTSLKAAVLEIATRHPLSRLLRLDEPDQGGNE